MPMNCSYGAGKMTKCLDSMQYGNPRALLDRMPYVLHLQLCARHILIYLPLTASASSSDAPTRGDSERCTQNCEWRPSTSDCTANACSTSSWDLTVSAAEDGRSPCKHSDVTATYDSSASGEFPGVAGTDAGTGTGASASATSSCSRTGSGVSGAGRPRVERLCGAHCGGSGAERSASLSILCCSSDELVSWCSSPVASLACR